MKKNKSKDRVLIYALYEEDNYIDNYIELVNLCCDKENEMKKYCEDKEYKLIETIRCSNSDSMSSVFYDFLDIILIKYPTIHCPNDYITEIDKIIIYDLYDLGGNINQIKTLFELLEEHYIKLETIKQGEITKEYFRKLEVVKDGE